MSENRWRYEKPPRKPNPPPVPDEPMPLREDEVLWRSIDGKHWSEIE